MGMMLLVKVSIVWTVTLALARLLAETLRWRGTASGRWGFAAC